MWAIGIQVFSICPTRAPDTGNDVAVLINGRALGFISAATSAGYSRLLLKTGPWGRMWNQAIYAALFDAED